MKKFALLCPGQGGQFQDMFKKALEHPLTVALVARMDSEFAPSDKFASVLADPKRIFENLHAQPLVVASTLANWHAMRSEVPVPALVAGYSVGEIAAHAVGGAVEILPAVQLAKKRAEFMQACVEAGSPHAMIAVSGPRVEVVADHAKRFGLYIAIATSSTSCLVAGLESQVKSAFEDLSRLAGSGQCKFIAVAIASHTPLMEKSRAEFAKAIPALKTDDVAVLAGISGEVIGSPEQIRSALLAQLTHTIRWDECMNRCREEGISFALELGPGSALTKMFQAQHPQINCRSLDEFRSLSGAIDWVNDQARKKE